MNEGERVRALEQLLGADVPRETLDRLERFERMLLDENRQQNLISSSSEENFWDRHILDGAQLLPMVEGRSWLDIGSGPGLPGVVVAILGRFEVTLNEPRRLRADFLRRVIAACELGNASVAECKVEKLTGSFDVISARAVARLDRLFTMAWHVAHKETKWVLPKGESAQSELDEARRTWQGSFQLVPSRTHPASAVVIAQRVERRGKR